MDELIILQLQGRASPEELRELRRWRAVSETHEGRYQEIRALWELYGRREEVDPHLRIPSGRELLRPKLESEGRGRSRRRRWLAAAAAVAAIVASGVVLRRSAVVPNAPARPATVDFRTGPSELRTAVLSDGSVARLGPNTTLRATFAGDRRDVRLEGRAFFAVAHDPARPFRVHTAAGEAEAMGTRFEVDARRSDLRVLVVDGTVALTSGDVRAKLGAGEEADASGGAPPTVSRVAVPEASLGWMGPWMAFESTPLRRVARELEVRLGVTIAIADPRLADRTLTGWFGEEDKARIVSMICRVADVRCTRSGDLIRIEDIDAP